MTPPPEVPGVSWGTARIGEEGAPPAELDRLGPDATERRRATFVAGRRAAHRALEAHLLEAHLLEANTRQTLRVDADAQGKPTVSRPGVELSITHAGGWALAAASRAPLGVDLVEREPLSDAFAAEAFAAGELAAWSAWEPDPVLARCLAFAGKEAALKWLGVGMGLPLQKVRVLPEGRHATVFHPDGRVRLGLVHFQLAPELWAVLLAGGRLAR